MGGDLAEKPADKTAPIFIVGATLKDTWSGHAYPL